MKRSLKKSVVAGLGTTAAAAALFAGAGSAHAFTWVNTNTDALGVTVHVMSFGGPASSGWCTYTAIPNGPGVPVYGVPFYLQENGTHNLWFPGIQTGTTWDVDVSCQNGVNSATQQVVY
ncbi:hypothetical protein ABGB19_09470 [Mycobacterium sp. B14F4]|uniref:hypothetical protein n=1 Tax=Mycobacterium sp. B14F4 TaxID=3153565 RepID=UPI00325CF3BF